MNGVLFPNGTQMMLAGDRDDCNAEGAMAAAMRSVLEGATSACLLRSFSVLKVISLPRQARGKHSARESPQQETRFLAGIAQAPSAPCVCKGCNTTSCGKSPPLPPTPPPIPPPPPPPAKDQTCKMAGDKTYTCPLDDPVCCSVQFGSVASPAASSYCCNGPSPVCCQVGARERERAAAATYKCC